MIKFVIILLLTISCSMLQSKTDRCFDLFEQYGTVNMNIYLNGRETFSCTDKER